MSPSIFLMLHTDLFARPTTKSHIYIRNDTNLSKHSSNKKVFKESTEIYQEALKKSEYDHQLTYQKSINNKNEEKNNAKEK